MIRVVGVNLPDDKRIEYALTLIYGVGWGNAKKILAATSINKDKKVKDLTEDEVKRIQNEVEKKYKVEGDLKEEVRKDIKRLKDVGCYRGTRHIKGLPVKGQRTKSNARTKRGKRKTVGALKKEDRTKLQDQPKITQK